MMRVVAVAWLLALAGVEGMCAFQPTQYHGGMLGVKAHVTLYHRQERALVRLEGLPVGGRIAGVAWFKKDGTSVDLDVDLEAALRRRHVCIEGAGALYDESKVWVLVRLPLGLGRRTIVLDRIDL